MGKALDDRIVEYAYVERIMIHNNIYDTSEPIIVENEPMSFSNIKKTDIVLTILYDIKDSNKNKIGNKEINHILYSGTEAKTITQINELISNNLETLVNADKAEISGYTLS